jgi:hypothetical protein
MKIKMTLGASVIALALLAGCALFDAGTNQASQAANSNSTAKNPTQGAPKEQQPAANDPRDYMTVYTPYPGWPKDGAGLDAGWWVTQKSTNAAGTSETKYAVVAVAGDVVKVEITNAPGLTGYIEALLCKKSDGTVSWAGAGKKGEKPKDLKVQQMPQQQVSPPPSTDEDLTVKAGGPFKSKKTVTPVQGMGDSTSWVGTDGDTKDVLLKSTFGTTTYELSDMPAMEDWTCSGKTMKVKHLKWTNGMETWQLDAMWPFVYNSAKMSMAGNTTEITGTGTDAKPELTWEK